MKILHDKEIKHLKVTLLSFKIHFSISISTDKRNLSMPQKKREKNIPGHTEICNKNRIPFNKNVCSF